MTPAQVAHIMALVDKYGEACDNFTTGTWSAQSAYARAAVEAALRDAPQQAEPPSTEALQILAAFARTAPGRLPFRVQEALAVVDGVLSAPTAVEPDCAGGMPCTDCPDRRKCQAGCIRQGEALTRPDQESPPRHPLDVESLYELQKVMADFGGDWPEVPGEQEVVRRAKMLSRLWKTDRAAQENNLE